MYYYNGDVYDGQWVEGKRQGRGKYTFSTGKYYDGKLFNSRTHGYYWSKECGTITSETAFTLEIYTKGHSMESQPRYESLAVRPVTKK